MGEGEILNRMLSILEPFVRDREVLGEVNPETHIIDDLKVNSARLVDIIIEAEDAFDIVIEDDDADAIGTVGDMVQVIACKVEQQAA